jgi:hypothetical protein
MFLHDWPRDIYLFNINSINVPVDEALDQYVVCSFPDHFRA